MHEEPKPPKPSEADEVSIRRDEALRRFLSTPPKPHEDMKLGSPRGNSGRKTRDRSRSGQEPEGSDKFVRGRRTI